LHKDAELETSFDKDPCQKQEEFAKSLGVNSISHLDAFTSIENDSKTKKSHEAKRLRKAFSHEQLAKTERLHDIVTDDEKQIYYDNSERKVMG